MVKIIFWWHFLWYHKWTPKLTAFHDPAFWVWNLILLAPPKGWGKIQNGLDKISGKEKGWSWWFLYFISLYFWADCVSVCIAVELFPLLVSQQYPRWGSSARGGNVEAEHHAARDFPGLCACTGLSLFHSKAAYLFSFCLRSDACPHFFCRIWMNGHVRLSGFLIDPPPPQ